MRIGNVLRVLTALLLLAVLLCLAVPALAADTVELKAVTGTSSGGDGGLLREPAGRTYPAPKRTRGASALAVKYDPREDPDNLLTSVRDQGGSDLCWAFGTLGLLETQLKKNGYGEQDLSEMHMAYATSSSGGNDIYGSQYRTSPSSGGNRLVSAPYLMRGVLNGAAMELDDPYILQNPPERSVTTTQSVAAAYRAKNILFLSDDMQKADVQTVKKYIESCGAVAASLYWNGSTTHTGNTGSTTTYYNSAHYAYYYNGAKLDDEGDLDSNHMGLIVGWDDEFPVEYFNEANRPTSPGAWLIKNSWGDDWGDSGFYWISYEDSNFPLNAFAIEGAAPYEPTDMLYEHDYTAFGAGIGGAYDYATVFTTKTAGEVLTSVCVQTFYADTTLEIDVVTDATALNGWSPYTNRTVKGTLVAAYPGWYTVELDTPVTLGAAGTSFAVTVHTDDSSNYLSYDDQNVADPGSHYYYTGSAWQDISSYYNLCVKAETHRHAPQYQSEIPATCTEPGRLACWLCSCGKFFSDETAATEVSESDLVIAAQGHLLMYHTPRDPGCTEAGNVEYWYCMACGKYFVSDAQVEVDEADTQIAATGHTLTHADAVAATCTAPGSVEFWYCSNCGKYYADEQCTTELETTEVPAAGHSYTQVSGVAPTCTSGGWGLYTCSVCNDVLYEEYGALGHDIVHHEAQAPSCTEVGWDAYDACTRCDYTTYTEIAATGHDMIVVQRVEPTTEADGMEITRCTHCGKTEYTVLPKLPAGLPGDVNGDNKVNMKDVLYLRQGFAGGYGVTLDPVIADLNHDGRVNMKDLLVLRQYLAGGYGIVLT